MSLLDKASLIVTPNAYKESKLYSVVPSSGAGDMDVVRATTATRVNSSGLIEVVPRNLLTYSNDFSNAAWGTGGYGNRAVVISNDIISPDGLMNGSKITFSAGVTQARLFQQTPVINGGIYEASIFLKYGNKNTISFYCDAAVIGLVAEFNFTTKVLTPYGVTNPIVTELQNGWFKIQYTYTAPSSTSQIGFLSNVGEDGFIYAYGGQVEQGSTATEYFPTTTRLNIPRIDYTNGSCPSLLVEPQRMNIVTYSQNLDTNWVKAASTVETNSIVSPDGTQNATKLNVTTTVYSGLYQIGNISVNKFSSSIFAKKGTKDWLYFVDASGTNNVAWFNLANGTLGTVNNGTASIEDYGNGWYKCSYSDTNNITNAYFQIGLSDSNNSILPTSSGYGYIWGAQREVGSYATSYIPTVASSVTRNADIISKTGISSLIGQTEGVFYFENIVNFKNLSSVVTLPLISNSSNSDYIILYVIGDNIYADINIGFAYITTIQLGSLYSLNLGSTYKLAIQYNASGIKTYNNGVLIQTVSTVISNYSAIRTSSNTYLNNKAIILFKQYLTDAECIALTTL